MQEKSGGEASEPPDKKNGIIIPPSDPSQLSVSFERSVREKTKENTTTPCLALFVDEKTTQKHNPQDPPPYWERMWQNSKRPKLPVYLREITRKKSAFYLSKTAPAKNFSKQKPLFSSSLEEKGAKVSTKKSLTEVEKVSSKSALVLNTTTTTITGSPTKNPAPVSDKANKKNFLGTPLKNPPQA